tara:strand:+ start:1162 stop:1344 length:183 start_codon:yes stop_codon:yes gene_type:complete
MDKSDIPDVDVLIEWIVDSYDLDTLIELAWDNLKHFYADEGNLSQLLEDWKQYKESVSIT